MRFYAGIPLTTSDGRNVGSLCLIDTRPREFGPDDIGLMSELARLVVDELELRLSATRDALTGALSRRGFEEDAMRTMALALRHDHELGCIGFDIDHFKKINDTYGHAAGDEVLASVVRTCMAELRATDSIGRMGGEEFAVLLPNTGLAGADRCRQEIVRGDRRSAGCRRFRNHPRHRELRRGRARIRRPPTSRSS